MAQARTIGEAWAASKSAGNNFDAIRFIAAALVIFSHSFEMNGGARADEPLEIISGQISFGELAVLVFFAVSGFLIAKSWTARPRLADFARNRALRIMPALIACVVILALVAGPLLTSLSPAAYFSDARLSCFLLNAAFVSTCGTLPGVFGEGLANAPLWTLAFEAQCYALVAGLGMVRLLKPAVCVALAVALMIAGACGAAAGFGGAYLYKLSVLAPPFMTGAAFAVLADRTPLDQRLAGVSALVLLVSVFSGTLVAAFAIFGVYLVLWAAFAPLGAAMKAVGARGDFSYGLYLWGWPVQQTVAQLVGGGPALNFCLSLPIAFALAVLSWRLLEAPALALKAGPARMLNFRKPPALTLRPPFSPAPSQSGRSNSENC